MALLEPMSGFVRHGNSWKMPNIFQSLAQSCDGHFDYTEWRKDHLFVGETVDTLVDKIRAFEREHSEFAGVRHG